MNIFITDFSSGKEVVQKFSNCSYCPTSGLYKTLTKTLRVLSDKISSVSDSISLLLIARSDLSLNFREL